MALVRTSTGLLFRDPFDRENGPPGANWDIESGTWVIEDGRLKHTPSANGQRIRCVGFAARGEQVVQVIATRSTTSTAIHPHPFARNDAGDGYLFVYSNVDRQILRADAWSFTGVASTANNIGSGVGPHTLKMACANGSQRQWYQGGTLLSGADTDHDAVDGTAGLRTSYGGGALSIFYDDFIVCAHNRVTVDGLPTGYKIRVGSLTETESSGEAVLDVGGATFPATLEILDAADRVVATTGDVWGGDEYEIRGVLDLAAVWNAGTEAFDLSWSAVPGATAKVVQRTGADGTVTLDTLSGAATSFADTTAEPLRFYEYRVITTVSGGDHTSNAALALQVDDLDLWLSARGIPHADGVALPTLRDWSGNDVAITSSTGAGTYRPAGTPSLDDRATIQSTTDTGYGGGTALSYGGKAGITVMAVVDIPGPLSNDSSIIGRDGSGDRGWFFAVNSDGRLSFRVSTAVDAVAARAGGDVDLQLMPAVVTGRYNGGTGELSLWVNGVPENGTLTGTVPATIAEDGPALGVFRGVAWNVNFLGHGAEILAIGRAVSNAELAALHTDLMAYYDLVGLELTEVTGNVRAGQGVAADATHRYTVDHGGSGRIQKRNASWGLVTENTDPMSGLDSTAINDGGFHDGKLYVSLTGGTSGQRIGVYDADDLSRLSATVPDDFPGFGASGITVDPVRGVIWACLFQEPATVIRKFDLATFAWLEDVTLSQGLYNLQGISFNPSDGMLWTSAADNAFLSPHVRLITRIDPDTGRVRRTYRRRAGYAQGLDVGQGDILFWAFNDGPSDRTVRVYGISGVPAPTVPTPATIAAIATAPGEITVTRPTAAVGADSVALYVADDEADLPPEGPEAGATLLSSVTGWPPHVLDGLGFDATRYFAEYATNTEGTVRSNVASATTDPDPATLGPPVLVDQITTTGARYRVLSAEHHPAATHIRYRTRTTGGTLVDDETVAVSGDSPYTVAGLDPETVYSVTAAQVVDTVESAEGDATLFQTLAEVVPPPSESRFTSPPYATAVSGDDVEYTWDLDTGRSVTLAEVSTDMGSTWTTAAGHTDTGISIDTTAMPNGLLLLRITLDNDTVLVHPGVVVANSITVYERRDFDETDEFIRYLRPTEPLHLFSGCLTGHVGHAGAPATQAPIASIGVDDPIELTFHRRAFAATEVAGWGILGGIFGTGSRSGEYQAIALALVGTGETASSYIGIRAGLDWTTLGHNTGHGFAQFRVAVGDMTSRPTQTNWHEFAVTVPVAASLWFPSCVDHPIRLWLDVERPDPGTNPNRYDIAAYCEVPYPHGTTPDRRFRAVIEQTVDVTDPIGSEPHTLVCGRLEVMTQKQAHQYAEYSRRTVVALTAWADADSCDEPPTPPEPEPPEPFVPLPPEPGRPCTLLYQHFEADRETIAWEATTELGYLGATGGAVPFLVDPSQEEHPGHYGEQENDFAECRASLIRAAVMIADVHQTPGDQDSGWMTERLSEEGRTAIHGHRGRYLRFIDFERGWVVIADGPNGTPSMGYADARWQIRDTRETERKTRAFVETDVWLLPPGIPNPYGLYTGSGEGEFGGLELWLVDAAMPLTGTYEADPFVPVLAGTVNLEHYWSSITDPVPIVDPDVVLTDAAREALQGNQEPVLEGFIRWTWPNIEILWRAAGTEDPWTSFEPSTIADPEANIALFTGLDAKLDADDEDWVHAAYQANFYSGGVSGVLPADEQEIEFAIRYKGPPTPDLPLHIDGITAGELVVALYEGEYSPRDENGDIRPTGIRYHAPDVLALTTPVRLRITEPAKDVRDWVERYIYRPLGYAPALDFDGRISPMSQLAPEDMTGAVDINDLITEPAPSWNAGERIINEVVFSYERDYVDPDSTAIDGLSSREVQSIWRQTDSIDRHGDQVLEISGLAFRAIGSPEGLMLERPEVSATLAEVRGIALLDRYGEGAQSFVVKVMRDPTALLRAGSWVTCDLSWFPDYVSGRRGMVTMGQIVAIKDLDCAWREIVFEEAFPVELPGPPDFGS